MAHAEYIAHGEDLSLSPAALEWMKQQPDVSQAIEQLICDQHNSSSEALTLNQLGEVDNVFLLITEVLDCTSKQVEELNRQLTLIQVEVANLQLHSARQRTHLRSQQLQHQTQLKLLELKYHEQSEISQEQINTLQQQLQEKVDDNEVSCDQIKLLETKLKTLVVQQLSSRIGVATPLLSKQLEQLAQQVVTQEFGVNGKFLIAGCNRLAVKTAFSRFITLLLQFPEDQFN